MTVQENALTDIRAEWVSESTVGEPPSNPSWNKFSDYIKDFSATPGLSVSTNEAVGSGDNVRTIRGAQTDAELTVEYWLQRFPEDSNGNVVDPIAFPFVHDFNTEYESHTVVFRRISDDGGAAGAGFRQYTVAFGARPTSATIPGDPGDDEPLSLELGYTGVEKVRTYVIDQPSSSTTLDLVSTSSNDTAVDVTIENEGAGTTETITLNGTTTVTTTSSFGDIDAVFVSSGEPDGDITVSDGNGNDLLVLDGKNTDGIDFEQGVPTLGSGSHASDIGNNPETFLFLNTTSTFNSSAIADRVHQLDLTAEVETNAEPQEGTRRPVIDIGTRTVTAEAEIAEDTGTTNRIREFFRGTTGDVELEVGGTTVGSGEGTITLKEAQLTEVDDQQYSAGDANNIYAVTFTASDEDGDGQVALLTKN